MAQLCAIRFCMAPITEFQAAKSFGRVRLSALCVIDPDTGCWNWTGPKSKYGGHINYLSKKWIASRFSYILHYKKSIKGYNVAHKCNNINCVNPKHLEVITKKQHAKRVWAKRPHQTATHCANGHRLTAANVHSNDSKRGKTCAVCQRASAKRYRERKKMYHYLNFVDLLATLNRPGVIVHSISWTNHQSASQYVNNGAVDVIHFSVTGHVIKRGDFGINGTVLPDGSMPRCFGYGSLKTYELDAVPVNLTELKNSIEKILTT
jgi:hypothetical protein